MKYDEYMDFLGKLNLPEDQGLLILAAIHELIKNDHDLMIKAKGNPDLIEEYNFRNGRCSGLGLTYKLIAGTLAYTDELDCSWPDPEEE